MPLDAVSEVIGTESLVECLERREISPVDWNVLEAHKQTQLRRFGPSFWYRHQRLLGFALIASIGAMAFTAGLANPAVQPTSPVPVWISMGWMCLVAVMIMSGVFRARAGSHWEERWLP